MVHADCLKRLRGVIILCAHTNLSKVRNNNNNNKIDNSPSHTRYTQFLYFANFKISNSLNEVQSRLIISLIMSNSNSPQSINGMYAGPRQSSESPGNISAISAEDEALVRLTEQSEAVYRHGVQIANDFSNSGTQKLLDNHKAVLKQYFLLGLTMETKLVEEILKIKECKIHEHVTALVYHRILIIDC